MTIDIDIRISYFKVIKKIEGVGVYLLYFASLAVMAFSGPPPQVTFAAFFAIFIAAEMQHKIYRDRLARIGLLERTMCRRDSHFTALVLALMYRLLSIAGGAAAFALATVLVFKEI